MRIQKIIVTLCLLVFSFVAKAEQGDTAIIRPAGSAFCYGFRQSKEY